MEADKHKLEMIMELCGSIMEEMAQPDEEESLEEKPVAAIEITKVGEPEELEDEEEEAHKKRFMKNF